MSDFVVKAKTIAGAISLDNLDHTPWVSFDGAWYCRLRVDKVPSGLTVVAEGNDPYMLGETIDTDKDGIEYTSEIVVGTFF